MDIVAVMRSPAPRPAATFRSLGVCVGILSVSILSLLPSPAYAHSSVAGIGDFYNGVLHPIYSPAHLLVLIALGLMIGQRSMVLARTTIPSFALLCALGLACTTVLPQVGVPQVLLCVLAMLVAIVVILEAPISPLTGAALGGVAGVILGLDSIADGTEAGPILKMLIGSWVAMFFAVFTLPFYVSLLTRHWQRIALRVAGSWIFAITLLILAFTLKRSQ